MTRFVTINSPRMILITGVNIDLDTLWRVNCLLGYSLTRVTVDLRLCALCQFMYAKCHSFVLSVSTLHKNVGHNVWFCTQSDM
jgi:hypothetical protein